MSINVFYLNPGATDEVLSIIREAMPPGWRLLSPRAGNGYGLLAKSDFLLVPDQPVTAEHLLAAPRLRMIQHQGVGYERIDLEVCRTRRVPVCLTPDGTTIGVAEHTLLLILALYRQLVTAAAGVRGGRWMQWELRGRSFELSGKRLGLVGLGRIGREVATRAAAFGAKVLYFDPQLFTPPDLPVTRTAGLDELLAHSDIVSLHVPLTSQSRHLINRETLERFQPSAMLVNTSRGGLVDESALVAALQRGRLAGAALDVLEQEPPDPANPLLHMENVLITPHIAAGTRDALQAKMRSAFSNMMRRTRGEPLHHLVPELADLFPAH